MITILPGDIPGLLLHSSPVLWGDEPCLVQCDRDGVYRRVDGDVGGTPELSELRLDLRDRTGRVHAAWWFNSKPWGERRQASLDGAPMNPMVASDLLVMAASGADMTPTQIDTLARLVLRLAGKTP